MKLFIKETERFSLEIIDKIKTNKITKNQLNQIT
jgi:hypothetical protein